MQVKSCFRFDDVVLDLEAFRLSRDGQPVHLEPKVLELLGYLVQHRGRLVEKPELQAAIWRHASVSESSLTRAVAQLRRALDDDAREARYVETVPTRGYRFRPEVEVVERRGARGTDGATSTGASGPAGPARPPGRRITPAGAVAGIVPACALVFLAAQWLWTPRDVAPAHAVRERHRTLVSTSRGFNGFPAFSPDSGALAYSSDRSGRLEIYLRPLVPGAREAPVTGDAQDNVQPAWSPDGRYIAYHSIRRGGLWLVPALGGAPRQISTFGSAPAWSPDGSRIAFSSLGLASLDGVPQYAATLWMLDAPLQAATARRLTRSGQPQGGHGSPVFSPEGGEVLFAADAGVWAVASGGGTPRRVADGAALDVALAPDGRRLFWTGWERGNWHIWTAPLPCAGAPAGARRELVNTGDQAPRALAMSRGGRLAYGLTTLASELALVRLDASFGPAGAPTEPWPGSTGRKSQLHFSPDGRTLAFGRFQPGQGLEIWGLDISSSGARPLLPGAELSQLNGWFPGGEALLATARGAGAKSLVRAPLTGSAHEPLAPADAMRWARLVPPGRDVVYHSVVDGMINVLRSRLDGGEPRPLTRDPQGVGWPVPSPDGRTLAVELFRGNDAQLGLVSAQGGDPRPISRLPGQHWVHDWSPDGRRVLYAARRDGLWNVYWIDVESGEERRLTDHGRVRESARTPAWSPAGDLVAYERLEAWGAVWLMDLD